MIIALSFILFFAIGFFLIWMLMRKSEDEKPWFNPTFKFGSLPNVVSAALKTAGVPTRIVFNGQEYSSPEEMPAEIRRAYEQAMSGVLADADHNGIPDLFESGGGTSVFQSVRTQPLEDPAERLRKVKEMRDSGLITEQEYEAKKAEILDRM